jgi:hypothetical protein
MCPGDLDAGGLDELAQAADGGVQVHPGVAVVEQERPRMRDPIARVYGPADCGRQRDQDHPGALPAYPQDPVAVFFAKVGDVAVGGFQDPQAEQAEHGHQSEVIRVW